MPHTGPTPIGDIVAQILGRTGCGCGMSGQTLAKVWRDVVGPRLSQGSRPGALRGRVLEVLVSHSVFAQELTFEKEDILARLRACLSDDLVDDLRIRVGAWDC